MKPYRRLTHISTTLARQHLYELLPDDAACKPITRRLRWLSKPFPKPTTPLGERLRDTLCQLGPVFIKLGQLLATRHDLFPDNVIKELEQLQDAVPPFPTDQALARITEELKQPIDHVFSHVDASPLASASIAQVYGATLHSGESVIIKILRPSVRHQIEQDLAWLKLMLAKIEQWVPSSRRLHPTRVISTYETIILNEVDLLKEMHNTLQFARNFDGSPLLYVPTMHTQWCTSNMLVAERITGIPLNEIDRLDAAGIDRKLLAERGVEIFFTQVFRDNFFHADMHGGNIFVTTDNPTSPRYISLDCAIVGHLPERDLLILAKTLMALLSDDYEYLAELLVEGGWSQSWVDTESLAHDLKPICEPVLTTSLRDLSFGTLLTDLFSVAQQHDLQLQPQFVLLKKTLIHVEGLGRQLYPDLDIWTLGRPLLKRWLERQLNPIAVLKTWGKHRHALPFMLSELPSTLRQAHRWVHEAPQALARQQHTITRLENLMKSRHKGLLLALVGTLIVLLATLTPNSLWDIPLAIRGVAWLLGGGLLAIGSKLALQDQA